MILNYFYILFLRFLTVFRKKGFPTTILQVFTRLSLSFILLLSIHVLKIHYIFSLCLFLRTFLLSPSLLLSPPKTHTNRQATMHGCLHSLLGDGDKGSEIVYCEKKMFCTGPIRAAKAEQKSLALARQAQQTNQVVLFESPFISVSTGATPL
jgi:hypothetical protein